MCYTTLISIGQNNAQENSKDEPDNYFNGVYNNETIELYPNELELMAILKKREDKLDLKQHLDILIKEHKIKAAKFDNKKNNWDEYSL
jgi:hypothetical protein